jgi:nucleotide-binding universal stress UspA family protein
MIKKVLIATDGSEHANKAVVFGSDIAAKYDAGVVLLHVMLRSDLSESLRRWAAVEHIGGEEPQPLSRAIADISPGGFLADVVISSADAATIDRVLHAVADQVIDQAKQVAREHGVANVSARIEDGDPAARILEVAAAEGVDLVVAGARGLSDLKALLVGSVSHKISHLSPVTCITVR